jgi:predicted ATPase
MLGMTIFHLGGLAEALKHFESGLAIYDMDKRRSHRALQDPGVACLSYRAAAFWLLGYPDQAVEISREAIRLADRLSHPFSLAYALNIGGLVSQLCRNVQEVRDRAEAAEALCQDHGIPYWSAWGPILRGWALAREGRNEEGIRLQQEGLASYNSTGARLVRTYFLTLLVESYRESGRTEEALAVIEEGLTTGERTGERWFEAELHRLKGDILLESAPDQWSAAQECLNKALDTARSQSAKSLELRAAMSLFKLYRNRGALQQGRQILLGIYEQLTEGIHCADVRDAQSLLEEVG